MTQNSSRESLLTKMRDGQSLNWDVIIVGGGITGAGVLRETVRRGYKHCYWISRIFLGEHQVAHQKWSMGACAIWPPVT